MSISRRVFLSLLVFLAIADLTVPAAAAEKLTLYMTEIPGQTMLDESESGTALDIARAMAERAGFALDERFLPWTRAVVETERGAAALIIPFSRIPSREKRFHWIAELYDLQFGFVSLGTPVNDKAQARTLPRLGVWRGTSMEEELRSEGFTNLVPVSNDQALGRMLIGGRFAAWYGSLNEAAYKFRGIEEVNRRKIRFGKPVAANPVWLAAGLKLPRHTVDRLRAAMNEIRGDGTIESILERYGLGEIQ